MTGALQDLRFMAMGAAAAQGDYAHGVDCLFHGPMSMVRPDENGQALCPVCCLPLRVVQTETFWADVRQASKAVRDLEAMLRWSTGRCFSDYNTLEEAWRQESTE